MAYYHVVDTEPYAGGTVMRAATIEQARKIAKEYLTKWPDAIIEIRQIVGVERWYVDGWSIEKEKPDCQGVEGSQA